VLKHADKLPDPTKAALAKPAAIPGAPVPHLLPMQSKEPKK